MKIGKRVTGTIVGELPSGMLIIDPNEMAESKFDIPPNYIWPLRMILEVAMEDGPEINANNAKVILKFLERNVLSGAKGSDCTKIG